MRKTLKAAKADVEITAGLEARCARNLARLPACVRPSRNFSRTRALGLATFQTFPAQSGQSRARTCIRSARSRSSQFPKGLANRPQRLIEKLSAFFQLLAQPRWLFRVPLSSLGPAARACFRDAHANEPSSLRLAVADATRTASASPCLARFLNGGPA